MFNYEKMFNKLLEQTRMEYDFAVNSNDDEFRRGMLFAYGSIKDLAEKLASDPNWFNEDEV